MLTLVAATTGALSATFLMRAARRADAGEQARRLGEARRWRLQRRARAWLARALEDAAIGLEPEAAFELWIATVVAVAIPSAVLAPTLGLLSALAALIGGPTALHFARDRARRRLIAGLPGALEQIAAGLRGGATVGEAMGAVADGGGPLASDLARVRARSTLGPGLVGALSAWSAERRIAAVRATCGALAVASSVGGPAAGAIEGLAGSLRDRLSAVAEARALSAQARVSAIVVGAAPIAYLGFSAIADPASLGVLVNTGAGRFCLALGVTFEILGVLVMRRIVRAEDSG
ncbi:MAG: type II secretion system F family protein [Acidimicrobiia bacterium]